MLFIYNLALIILSVVCLPIILIAFIVQPKFRAGFFEKIGFYKSDLPQKKTFLIHAVSVGEVNAIEALVKRIRSEFPDYNLVLSTVTKTGHDVAIKKLEKFTDKIIYFPYDFLFFFNACFNTIKLEKIIIVEIEIWPNFVSIAKKHGIDVLIVNGRISPHSFNGYKKIKFFLKNVLNKYSAIYMQTKEDAQRMVEMGAIAESVEVMGNLKFDIENNLSIEEKNELKNGLQLNDNRLLVFASTHHGEDEICIETFLKLKEKFSDIKMLIAPRHPQRYSEVFSLLKNLGLKTGKRSNADNFEKNDAIMLDTMGELAKLYSICHCAFVGGSFVQTGGHNPLEVSIFEKPVLSGPVVFNFKDIYRQLCEKNASIIVQNSQELTENMQKLLENEQFYEEICQNARKVFIKNRGAINFVVNMLKK